MGFESVIRETSPLRIVTIQEHSSDIHVPFWWIQERSLKADFSVVP